MTSSAISGNRPGRHIVAIDGLRALAVLSVLIFHFHAAALPGGFSGVDVFFVISGYVVSASLARQPVERLGAFVQGFYARRILRIYPALLVCLLLAALAQSMLVPKAWMGGDSTSKTGFLAFFGLSNFGLIWFDDGYFSPRVAYNLFTHTWSLAVEEQFYLLFPLVMFAWLRWRRQTGATGVCVRWALAVLSLVSLAVCCYQTPRLPDQAYYLLPSRFWELGCGAMLLKLQAEDRWALRSDGSKSMAIALGLLLVAIGFVWCDSRRFPFPWAVLPVLGTVLAIAGSVSPQRDRSGLVRFLESAPMAYIGKISYSLYLWHWPIVVVFRWTLGLNSVPHIAAAAALTGVASVLSYHFIERPVRRTRFALTRPPAQVVSYGVLAIVCLAGVAGVVFKSADHLTLSVTRDRFDWYPDRWPAPPGRLAAVPSPLARRTLFAVGDSHTEAYRTLLQMLSDQQGVRVEEFARPGCPVAGLLVSRPDCGQFAEHALAQIRQTARPGDVVFLASLRMDRLPDADAPAQPLTGHEDSDNRAARLTALHEADTVIGDFEAAGLTVLIDAPKPVLKVPPFRCSDWFNRSNPICAAGTTVDRAWMAQLREPVMESLERLHQAHPRLVVWDPFPVLCPGSECDAYDNGRPLFFDADHLSAYGNRKLYPSFLATLQRIWPVPAKD